MAKHIKFSLILIVLLFSCNKKKENHLYVDKQKSLKFSFIFPDTLHINKKYDGEIKYENTLDSITTKFDDNSKNGAYRYIYFSLLKTNNIDYDQKYLGKIVKDTFGAIDCHTIPFYNIKFDKLGRHFIDGIINDYVSFETDKKDINGKIKSRIIQVETRATKEVYIIP